MKHYHIFVFIFFCCKATSLYSFVFNNSLDKKAEVDILVSVTQPTVVSLSSPIAVNSSVPIARYSFYFKANEQVMYWERLYSRYLPSFIAPEERFFKPTKKGNQFSITLTAQEIQNLTGKALTQLYVVIRQRTYAYNTKTGRLDFFSHAFLKQDFVPVGVAMNITASGIINATRFDELSASLKLQYPKAEGGAAIV